MIIITSIINNNMQMKIPSNFELDRYGLHVRLVREEEKEEQEN